jgi:hypothetical protein
MTATFDFTTAESTVQHLTGYYRLPEADTLAPWAGGPRGRTVYPTLADAFADFLTKGQIIMAQGSHRGAANGITVQVVTAAGTVIEDELYPAK